MTQKQLIKEEQKILNRLIKEMDAHGIDLRKALQDSRNSARNAKDSGVAEAYGAFVESENRAREKEEKINLFFKSRDQLYRTRLELAYQDSMGQGVEEIKIGLHTYTHRDRNYILAWTNPACRPYILNPSLVESDCIVSDKNGEKNITHYSLKLKRELEMFFDKVTEVTHLFPSMSEDDEKIIADEFLKQLLERRTEQEFRNIVFSIQEQQGEIIQTPYERNLIVQGCAGSGKSMIMLHRLPIVLFDNSDFLNRNSLYIITPSQTYIQMAEQMLVDLEIADLQMGTLEQYYNFALEKYGLTPDVYGKIDFSIVLKEDKRSFIYSEQCAKQIREYMEAAILKGEVDTIPAYQKLHMAIPNNPTGRPRQKIQQHIKILNTVLNANAEVLRKVYHNAFRICLEGIADIARMLTSRKAAVERGLRKRIAEEENIIQESQNELGTLDNINNGAAYTNTEKMIRDALHHIAAYQKKIDDLDKNNEYFNKLSILSDDTNTLLTLFSTASKDWYEVDLAELYKAIDSRQFLYDCYLELAAGIHEAGDPYRELCMPLEQTVSHVMRAVVSLLSKDEDILAYPYLKQLSEADDYYIDLEKNLCSRVYENVLTGIGHKLFKRRKMVGLTCSPYLYLQIRFIFQGPPRGKRESLITIDEAQNIEPSELRLIKAVNGGKVVFNLFGDVKQHVEGSKGIDSWQQFSGIMDYALYDMKENYRNASQITEFCNDRFGTDMRAINLAGRGVHVFDNQDDMVAQLTEVFQRPITEGLSCILVKDLAEAETFMRLMSSFGQYMNNLAAEPKELNRYKWNLMSVDQAKGLEFQTVVAFFGRMTKNEQYIACTRALDELYVCVQEPKIEEKTAEIIKVSADAIPTSSSIRRGRPNRRLRDKADGKTGEVKSTVAAFFQNAGLEVIDQRSKDGCLWVIGERKAIEPIVEEAVDRFGISGRYGSDKATRNRQGWCTKTEK